MKSYKNGFQQQGQKKPALIYFQSLPERLNFQRKIVASIRTLADFLNLSERTIYRYKASGLIPYLQLRPRHRILFFLDDVINALNHLPKKTGKLWKK